MVKYCYSYGHTLYIGYWYLPILFEVSLITLTVICVLCLHMQRRKTKSENQVSNTLLFTVYPEIYAICLQVNVIMIVIWLIILKSFFFRILVYSNALQVFLVFCLTIRGARFFLFVTVFQLFSLLLLSLLLFLIPPVPKVSGGLKQKLTRKPS